MSPKARTSAASERPDSSRKIPPMPSAVSRGSLTTTHGPSDLALAKRPNLDGLPHACGGLRGPFERGVQVVGLKNVEAGQVLLGFDKGPIGGDRVSLGVTNDRRGFRAMQRATEHPSTCRPDLLVQRLHFLPGALHLLL